MADINKLKEELAIGCRAMGSEEWVKSYGHVSARIPGSDLFLIPRNTKMANVKAADIWTYNYNNEKVEGGEGLGASEIPIHSCIYRARPDVMSVCHVHPHYAVLLTLVGETIKPITMNAQKYPNGVPVFEGLGLIVTNELGDAVAKALGDSRSVILRAHGAVSVGKDIPDCVTTMVSLEEMAKFQVEAMMIGKPRTFTPEEIEKIRATFKLAEKIHPLQKRGWDNLMSKIK